MQKPDSRVFASYPMPAKIDLLNERPRRESLVERQLENQIGQIAPKVQVNESENRIITTTTTTTNQSSNWGRASPNNNNSNTRVSSVSPNTEIRETRIVINQHSSPAGHVHTVAPMVGLHNQEGSESFVQQQQHQRNYADNRQQHQQRQPSPALNQTSSNNSTCTSTSTSTSTSTTTTTTTVDNKTILANELAQKEAKLMREIDALNQRPYSPYGQTPGKIDLTMTTTANEYQRTNSPMHLQQQPMGGPSTTRPHSSASSTAGQDFLEKEAKLLREIEEIESKPFNPQTMIVEREQWFEYPQNRPNEKHLTESRRRVRDFCSMPSGLCEDRHIHEENIPIKSQPSPTPASMHTTIIRSPRREIDNKSPLPFAFDNFSTKGVRGNIASVGAVEPDRPRPPIYPIVKRTPSPGFY